MTEDQLEQETLGWLAEVGYPPVFGPVISPDGPDQERDDYHQVLLFERLRNAIACLNPDIALVAREDGLEGSCGVLIRSSMAGKPRRWACRPRRHQRSAFVEIMPKQLLEI